MHPRRPFSVPVLELSPESIAEARHQESDLLPATFRTSDDDIAVPSGTLKVLEKELLVDRLNKIHSWLWMVGRPMPPRAIHYQRFLSREIVITEQMDLHLLWSGKRLFLKPIPRFLFSPEFWTRNLLCSTPSKEVPLCVDDPEGCKMRQKLSACAAGFLFSYTGLIMYESDYRIAHDLGLLPTEVTWTGWKIFVEQLLDNHSYHLINPRFVYGELRLGRINAIYRFTQAGNFVRGYQQYYTQYSDYFYDNLASIASIFAFLAIVLTAMQVGLATTKLSGSSAFQNASWGFTVFSIIAPMGLFVLVVLVFLAAFAANWIVTKHYEKKRFAHMGFSTLPRNQKLSGFENAA
jgi:hypothetical protein